MKDLVATMNEQKKAWDKLGKDVIEIARLMNILAKNGEPKELTDISESPKGTK